MTIVSLMRPATEKRQGRKRPIRNVRYSIAIGGKADVTRTSPKH